MARQLLITGCNRGIGRVAVGLFAEEGYDIICCIRGENPEFSKYAAELMRANHVKIEMIYCDMMDENAIMSAFKPLLEERRHIDVLINNAGIAGKENDIGLVPTAYVHLFAGGGQPVGKLIVAHYCAVSSVCVSSVCVSSFF